MKKSRKDGFTLAEMIMAIVIVGAGFGLLHLSAHLLTGFSRQQAHLRIQQSTQTAFQMMNRDVRNAHSFLVVSSTTLKITAFNNDMGYDVNQPSDIFEPTKIGTITYQYVAPITWSENFLPHLRRVSEFPLAPGVVKKSTFTFLHGMLVPASPENYISTCIPTSALPPYEEIQIVLRINPQGWGNQPIVYKANARLSTAQ